MPRFALRAELSCWLLLSYLGILCLATNPAYGQGVTFGYNVSGSLIIETNQTSSLPVILGQPQSQTVVPGRVGSFTVVAKDSDSLAYQWRFYGTNLSGAVADALLITNVSAANAGPYTVVLVNSSGSVTSAPAMLWIDSDRDGLPDTWEQTYFGGLSRYPTGDFDGDGLSNLDEFYNGTNPTNAASTVFKLTVQSDGGQVMVSPTKLNYTNGELVTLTATAFAPEIFHGWMGDVIASTNQVTIAMTTNKTVFASFQPRVITWSSGISGSWHNPSNWNPTLVPTAVDDVVLPINVTMTLSADSECKTLTFTTGTLDGPANLTITGQAAWTGGTMSGSGRTIIASGATLTINNPSAVTLGRTLENAGTTRWTGNERIFFSNGVITNRPGALFDVQNAFDLVANGGAPRIDNAGTFRKSVSAGTTGSAVPFNNFATLEVQSGVLSHNSGFVNSGVVTVAAGATHRMASGGSASGSFNGAATALVNWTGGTFTLNPGLQLNGAATYRLNSATLNCDADIGVANLELVAGTLGGAGVVTVSNTATWTGSFLSGSGRLIVGPTATLTINNPFSVTLGRTLENAGTTLWTGNERIFFSNGVITNRPGALFDVQNAFDLVFSSGAPRFDNAGTFRKSVSAGTTGSSVPFNNFATLEVQSGVLLHNAGFVNSGAVTVAAGATHRMASGGSANGSFSAAATALVNWTGGTFALNPGVQLNGAATYRLNSATLNCDADVGVANLELIAGTLGGAGVITVSNTATWTGSFLSGSGRLLVGPAATLTINNPFSVTLGRTLENAGTTRWTGNERIFFSNAVITNRPGALFDVQNAFDLVFSSGASRFDNAGTFRKSSSGVTAFGIPFNNYGLVNLRLGTLLANSGYVSSLAARLHSALGGPTPAANFGQLQVSGTLTLNGGLSVELTNNFAPSTNSFTLVTAGTRSGTFNNFLYPSNLVIMAVSNTPTSVIVTSSGLATNGPPGFARDLQDSQMFYAGRTATQSVTVAGSSPFSYQWKRNGTNLLDDSRISGAQSNVLMISNVTPTDSASYQVAVTNVEGFGLSAASTITVQAVPKLNANGAGWSLQGTTLPTMNSNSVTLTSGLFNTARSAFYNAPLYVPAFTASFIYRDVGGGGADGVTFCLQNASSGAAALGGAGGGLGYLGITPSVALAVNIYSPNTVGISLRTNGTLPAAGGYIPTTPVNLASGNPIKVSLLYTGAVLNVTLLDLTTASSFKTNFTVNVPAILGAETAYVGFTGSDAAATSTQVVSNYTFVPLTQLVAERPTAGSLALSWPASIGGYTMQSKSNLASEIEVWQTVTNPVVQVTNRNRVLIIPPFGNGNYRLKIDVNE